MFDRIAYMKAYKAANREAFAACQRRYYQKNKEKVLAKDRLRREAANKVEVAARKRKYHEANRVEIAARKKEYARQNREKINVYSRNWRSSNREKENERGREYYAANKEKAFARSSRRRARKLNAAPSWLTERQLEAVEAKYEAAQLLTERGEGAFAVDHIVPLQGRYVCGLHVSWNLQILTNMENAEKGNYLPPVDQLVDYSAKGYDGVRTKLKRALKGK